MSNLKTFLKVLNKFGYPNEDVPNIATMSGYDLDDFLPDLVDEVGQDKADEFVLNAISKISSNKGIRVNLFEDSGDGEYAYFIIHSAYIDLENDISTVLVNWSFGDSKILTTDEDGKEAYKTIHQIFDDVGMGEWSEYDELEDSIKESCNAVVYKKCGFGIWPDTHI